MTLESVHGPCRAECLTPSHIGETVEFTTKDRLFVRGTLAGITIRHRVDGTIRNYSGQRVHDMIQTTVDLELREHDDAFPVRYDDTITVL